MLPRLWGLNSTTRIMLVPNPGFAATESSLVMVDPPRARPFQIQSELWFVPRNVCLRVLISELAALHVVILLVKETKGKKKR